jgi:hypothetical protein
MAAANNSPGRARRSRSPGYPAVSLDVAIQRAKKVYDHEARNATPISALAAHWGFKAGTSSSNLTVASLKRFGLLDDEGSRESRLARLTDLALDIFLNPQPQASIQRAALTPKIHRELYEKYGASLPSDASLRHELIMTRGFTDAGADDFIRQFRRTLAFAHLDEESSPGTEVAPAQDSLAATAPSEEVQSVGAQIATEPNQLAVPASVVDTVAIPILLVGGESVTISGSFPITEPAWQQFIRVLEAMKPGLVAGTS